MSVLRIPLDADGTAEEWRPVVGFEGLYEVSSLGRARNAKWCRLNRFHPTPTGHLRLRMRKKGRDYNKFIHRLVLEAFVGPCPDGMECRHLDGDPENNRLSNLAWGTRKENGADKVKHGRSIAGMRHPFRKLTEADVIEIRTKAAEGAKRRELAAAYGVSPGAIQHIVSRRKWRHVP